MFIITNEGLYITNCTVDRLSCTFYTIKTRFTVCSHINCTREPLFFYLLKQTIHLFNKLCTFGTRLHGCILRIGEIGIIRENTKNGNYHSNQKSKDIFIVYYFHSFSSLIDFYCDKVQAWQHGLPNMQQRLA